MLFWGNFNLTLVLWLLLFRSFLDFLFSLGHFSLTLVLYSLVVWELLSGFPSFCFDPAVVAVVVWHL